MNHPPVPDTEAESLGLHQELFNQSAQHYDVFNSILSLGADRRWRNRAADMLVLPRGARVLDVGTGTAVSAIAIARRHPEARVTGIDINAKMLKVAETAVAQAGLSDRIELMRVNGEMMPFDDATFDAVVLSFTIEDMVNQGAGVKEIARVLKTAGSVVVLGLGGLPSSPVLQKASSATLRSLGLVLRVLDLPGYRHVRDDILTYQGVSAVRSALEREGFESYHCVPLSGGIVTLHAARFGGADKLKDAHE
jgi:demethylmenaquinone methyltransferase / 2-methoxy-6-polyprenyl-1,4-benzoquinol methylase